MKPRLRSRAAACFVVTLALVGALALNRNAAQGAPGDLDRSFGSAGRLMLDGPVRGLLVEPNGKFVASLGGTYDRRSCGSTCRSSFVLVRRNSDGSRDTSFGSEGLASADFGAVEAEAFAMVRQPNGSLVTAGRAVDGRFGSSSFALARFTSDGSLDTSFGSNGRVLTPFGYFAGALALVQQPDGKLVAAGTTSTTGGGAGLALARYNPDGSLDGTFGTQGRVVFRVRRGGLKFGGLLRQSNGALVVSAQDSEPRDRIPTDLILLRYRADGTPDPTFGRRGRVLTTFRAQSTGRGAPIAQRHGSFTVALNLSPGHGRLLRYDSSGRLDAGFGRGGSSPFRGARINALLFEPDGRLIAAGEACARFCQGFGVLRFTNKGSLDRAFGVSGRVAGPKFPCSLEREEPGDIAAVSVMPRRRLLAGGDACRFFSSLGALARYELAPLGSLEPLGSRQRLQAVRANGVRIEVRCAARCNIVSELLIDARTARRLGLSPIIGRTRSGLAAAGGATVMVRLFPTAARRLARVPRLIVTVRVRFSGAPARSDVVVRQVELVP